MFSARCQLRRSRAAVQRHEKLRGGNRFDISKHGNKLFSAATPEQRERAGLYIGRIIPTCGKELYSMEARKKKTTKRWASFMLFVRYLTPTYTRRRYTLTAGGTHDALHSSSSGNKSTRTPFQFQLSGQKVEPSCVFKTYGHENILPPPRHDMKTCYTRVLLAVNPPPHLVPHDLRPRRPFLLYQHHSLPARRRGGGCVPFPRPSTAAAVFPFNRRPRRYACAQGPAAAPCSSRPSPQRRCCRGRSPQALRAGDGRRRRWQSRAAASSRRHSSSAAGCSSTRRGCCCCCRRSGLSKPRLQALRAWSDGHQSSGGPKEE